MADAKLNMSLDQIIEQNAKGKPRDTTRKPAAKKPERRTATAVPKPAGIIKKRAPITTRGLKVSIVNRANISRNTSRTNNRHPATRTSIPKPAAVTTVRRAEPTGRWKHDRYEDVEPRAPRRAAAPRDGHKLAISNLDYRVSEDDIKELFSSIGALKSWKIDYDKSGRSAGTAEVVYVTRADAEKAKQQYNNVALDGKKMVIELEQAGGGSVFSRLSGPRGMQTAPRQTSRSGLQVTRTFKQATRDASTRGARTRSTGRMRGYEGDDYMEE